MNSKLYLAVSQLLGDAEMKQNEAVQLLKKDKKNIELIHKKELVDVEARVLRKMMNYMYIY